MCILLNGRIKQQQSGPLQLAFCKLPDLSVTLYFSRKWSVLLSNGRWNDHSRTRIPKSCGVCQLKEQSTAAGTATPAGILSWLFSSSSAWTF